jgi:cystathionine beta-synthase
VTNNPNGFATKVSSAMASNLVTLQYDQPISDLLPVFEKGMVAIVVDSSGFLGLITPIDLLQYLRKQTARA